MATRRRNGLALRRRRNGLALVRRNGQKDKMVMQAGGLSRAATKSLKKSNYKRYLSLFKKAGGKKELDARVGHAGERRTAMKSKFSAAKKKKAAAARKKAAPARKGRKRTTAKRKAGARRGRKVSAWARFTKKHAGKGWSMSKMADEYRKAGKKANPSRRRNTSKRRNPSRRRNTRTVGSRPMFGATLRTNQGMDTGIMPVDALAGVVDKVPFIGTSVAPWVAPLAVGALSGSALYYLADFADDYLPDAVQPYTLPLVGAVSGAAVLMVPRTVMSTTAKRTFAAGLALGGAVLWSFDWVRNWREGREMAGAGIENGEGFSGLALMQGNPYGAWEYTGQGALNNPSYGAWEYTGSGALNNPSYGAEEGTSEYTDADNADADATSNDFDASEGRALMMGPGVWWRQFGRPGKRMYNRTRKGTYSRHAGQRGHRWGWLIKLVGFQGARQIASMPPARRLRIIQQLKQQARAHLRASAARDTGQNIMPMQPHVYEESGVTGAHGYGATGGYGALMYSGEGPL